MKKLIFFCMVLISLVVTSCKTREVIIYMQDVPQADTTYVIQQSGNILIRPGDKLSIIVSTSIPELANTFNLSAPYRLVGRNTSTTDEAQTAYYTVDSKGEIDFPILGKLKVGGMAREDIADLIKMKLTEGGDKVLLQDAVVTVNYANLTFSVVGEVGAPGRYTFDKDRITVLEAISMAKDLTIMGKRENVMVSRYENDGKINVYRLDLRNTKQMINSPAYFVQQNDIIYVEPNKSRTRQTTTTTGTLQTPSFWISVASLLTTISALLLR